MKRYPHCAGWAGRKRQFRTAAPKGAVEDERRSMASNTILAARGGRGSKELDKKPIGLELMMGSSGHALWPGFGPYWSA
jgi:hypothetical protein